MCPLFSLETILNNKISVKKNVQLFFKLSIIALSAGQSVLMIGKKEPVTAAGTGLS
jgi:hypothetical protein